MSLGLVVLEKKLFMRTRTPTPQSDDIKTCFMNDNKAWTTFDHIYQYYIYSSQVLQILQLILATFDWRNDQSGIMF